MLSWATNVVLSVYVYVTFKSQSLYSCTAPIKRLNNHSVKMSNLLDHLSTRLTKNIEINTDKIHFYFIYEFETLIKNKFWWYSFCAFLPDQNDIVRINPNIKTKQIRTLYK